MVCMMWKDVDSWTCHAYVELWIEPVKAENVLEFLLRETNGCGLPRSASDCDQIVDYTLRSHSIKNKINRDCDHMALQQILFSIDLFLFYRTNSTDSQTI